LKPFFLLRSPESVNCTARTDLDTLARHVYTIADYNVVCFEPETDQDQGPYHDFLRYLGDKRRAGVAKWGDGGATLFLVPPSDFSMDVLKVPSTDRLLGVVMTFRSTQFAPPLQVGARCIFWLRSEWLGMIPEVEAAYFQQSRMCG
jgi:hypothetical protein